MRNRFFWLLSGLALVLLLAACGKTGAEHDASGASDASHANSAFHLQPNGDMREETASLADMPSFLSEESETVQLAYAAAAKLRETLQYIPCYCGCAQSAGHKSNLDCFIADVREDGTVVWDDHGTGCGVCQQIALQAAKMKQDGSSDLDIRKFVDAAYAEGYADPTDTPMPNA